MEGAAKSQRKNGMIPTTVDNERYLVDVLNREDRKKADAKPRAPIKGTKRPGRFASEAAKRGVSVPSNWSLDASRPLAAGGSILEVKKDGPLKRLLRKRFREMTAHPTFAARMKRINPLAMQGQFGRDKQEAAAAEFRKLLAESDKKWGEWWKPKAAPLFSYSGQARRG
jgi:hypothetical protein